jgi:hypothetical protein
MMKNERMDEPITTIRFLICRNCFWCASLIKWRSRSYEQVERHVITLRDNMCERCGNDQVKSIPVSLKESDKAVLSLSTLS